MASKEDKVELDFTPPREASDFRYYWGVFLEDIRHRENLKPSHLLQLKILCDLCVEYEDIRAMLEFTGQTYESNGRNGKQIKMKPEVAQKDRIVADIRAYCKALGLVLAKDTKSSKEEDNDFDD